MSKKSLRRQLVLATALATACATFSVIVGLWLYYRWQEAELMAHVSPDTRRVLDSLDLEMEVTMGHAEEINRAVKGALVFQIEPYVFLALAGLGVAVGVVVGFYLARRITRPIESVSRAAAAIARGELTARAAAVPSASGEPATLIADFNRMAESLERADRELSETAAAIAHELRTPITVLRARLQAVVDRVLPLSDRELVALIAQIDMLAAIVENLKVLSLAGAGRLPLSRQPVDLADEAVSVVNAMEGALRAAGMEVRLQLQPTPASADAARVRQALTALLDNAIAYAASGGVVEIRTYLEGDQVRLDVLDRGPGLPEGAEESIFDRFWRAEPSRSRASGGTGLGLAVVRAIAEEHGGQVMAQNRPDGGARFSIAFARLVG